MPYVKKIINNVETTNYGINFHISVWTIWNFNFYLQMVVLIIYPMEEAKLAKYFFRLTTKVTLYWNVPSTGIHPKLKE